MIEFRCAYCKKRFLLKTDWEVSLERGQRHMDRCMYRVVRKQYIGCVEGNV